MQYSQGKGARQWLCWAVLVCCVGWFAPVDVHAFELVKDNTGRVISWKSMPINIGLNPNGVKGITAKDVEAVFRRAANNWSAIKCAKITFNFRVVSSFANPKDNLSVISFPANFASKYPGGNLFQTNYRFDNNRKFTDIDIEMNPGIQWSLNTTGGGQDLENAAMVVLGYIIGLSNSSVKEATMYGGGFLSQDTSRRTLHSDDIAGAKALYPSGLSQCSGNNQCAANGDCPTGLGCQSGTCKAVAPTPPAKTCKTCATDTDCGSSQLVCDLVSNGRHCLLLCSPDGLCPSGYSCSGAGAAAQCLPVSGTCGATACAQDADCGQGFKCKSGKCEPECQTANDCPSNKPSCVNGRCVTQGACTQDLDCPPGQLCQSGTCKDDTTKQPCKTDNDCPANTTCQNGFCERTNACQAGATQACKCTSGGEGTQQCIAGVWGVCENCKTGGTTCQAGATQACPCPGGTGSGTQTCSADGKSWGTCTGCGGSNTCAPGSTQACVCSDGKSGAQTCNQDGSAWGTCQCTGTGGICQAGQTQACVCSDGKNGTQACSADGKSWGTCTGCGGSTGACTPGTTQACVCTNGQNGAQSCNQDGTGYAPCQCTGGPSPDGNTPADGGTQPACTTSNQCPAGTDCLNGTCQTIGGGGSGCGCDAQGSSTQGMIPTLLIALFFLSIAFRRRLG